MNRPTFGQIYMQLALNLAERSTCSRTKVGCVVVTGDHHQILSIGYNGGPKGLHNECLSDEAGKCGHLHGELNSIIKLDYNNPLFKKMYSTVSPCYNCAVAIINANIDEVVYLNEYRTMEGLDLLNRAGIKVYKFPKEDLLNPSEESTT